MLPEEFLGKHDYPSDSKREKSPWISRNINEMWSLSRICLCHNRCNGDTSYRTREKPIQTNKMTRETTVPELSSKIIALGVHDENISSQDLLIHLDAFPGYAEGDWLEDSK